MKPQTMLLTRVAPIRGWLSLISRYVIKVPNPSRRNPPKGGEVWSRLQGGVSLHISLPRLARRPDVADLTYRRRTPKKPGSARVKLELLSTEPCMCCALLVLPISPPRYLLSRGVAAMDGWKRTKGEPSKRMDPLHPINMGEDARVGEET